jgi:hypothetical protein
MHLNRNLRALLSPDPHHSNSIGVVALQAARLQLQCSVVMQQCSEMLSLFLAELK